MSFIHPSERSRLLEFLRGLATPVSLEQGLALAHAEGVVECSRASNEIQGFVRRDLDDAPAEGAGAAESHVTVTLSLLSARKIQAHCACAVAAKTDAARTDAPGDNSSSAVSRSARSAEDDEASSDARSDKTLEDGHWCCHAISLLWRAHELGFLSEDQGFNVLGAPHSSARSPLAQPSGDDIATVVRELSSRDLAKNPDSDYHPQVSVNLDLSSDRLGVQVLFDQAPQEPAVFESLRRHSARTLDNLLLRILDEEGIWDEEAQRWFVNTSEGASLVLGLLNEYEIVTLTNSHRRVRFSTELLNARVLVEWKQSSADISMEWVVKVPGQRAPQYMPREHDLVGNGPHWTLVGETIYRLSPEASKIAALFPHGPSTTLSANQVGPLLEAIQAGLHRGAFVEIANPEEQPPCEQRRPQAMLALTRPEERSSSLGADTQPPTVIAELSFTYPKPKASENVVILPDRTYEKECRDSLLGLGFEYDSTSRKFILKGDGALDIIVDGKTQLPADWEVTGFEALKRGVRFSQAKISVSMSEVHDESSPPSDTPKKKRSAGDKAIDWFDCHVSLVLNNATVPLSTLFKSSSNDDDRWLRLDNGAYTRVPGGSVRQLKGMLGMLDPNFRLSNSIKTRLSASVAVGLSRMAAEAFSLTSSPSLKQLAKQLDEFSGIAPVKVPAAFTGKLRPYQQQGVNWIGFLNQFKFGGILADEMGLGKTVQTLAFLQSRQNVQLARRKKSPTLFKNRPTLIVAPTSVMTNWWYEAKRFTPGLKVALLHGPKRKSLFNDLSEYDIAITSYALLRIDRFELERQRFDYVILDEAQHIKNAQAATTAAAKSLTCEHRLALTGTPTENRPLELWSILDFLMPGYLGTHDFFRTHIERPILERGGSVDVAHMLRAKTKPFILRRTKAEVERDLPPKIESVLHVEMTQSQRELYNHILEEVRPRVLEAVQTKGVAGASVSILAALLRLRQVCNHPNSIDALKSLPGYDSGKFTLLKDLLAEALENGRKILIFAQFREMLRIIRQHLTEEKVQHCYLDGATRDRQRIIDEFNTDPNVRVFLISLKAGGLGLNLTAADTVIIYDPWWNPAVENQAVDRAHRIGQTKRVHVYRLVTEDSVEQKIMTLKRKKAEIINALVNENGLTTASLSRSDIESLFTPLAPGTDES